MEERILSVNGHETRVLARGEDGPALVFLHGFPEYSGGWKPVFENMDGFQCFAPDQRGYGISYRPTEVADYVAGYLARDVFALIDVLGLSRVHLVGHDWGASVAYSCAFAYDPRIATLTIMNGVHAVPFQRAIATGGPQCTASQYINWLRRPGSEDVLAADNFSKLASFFAEGMDMSWMTGAVLDEYRAAWGDADRLRAMVNWYRASPLVVGAPGAPLPPDQIPNLPEDRMHVRVPHLLLWGEGDKALLPESRSGLDEFCSDLTVREIPGTDHWLHHQKPTEVAEHLRAFVTDHA